VRTSFLDDSHAYWNGTSLFFALEGEARGPCEVAVDAPALRWTIRHGAAARLRGGAAGLRAPTMTSWCDSPFEVGTHAQTFRFREEGAASSSWRCTDAHECRDIEAGRDPAASGSRRRAAIFGGGFPFRATSSSCTRCRSAAGGLEHRASVTMEHTRACRSTTRRATCGFAGSGRPTSSFTPGNVKRLHDPVQGPFDYHARVQHPSCCGTMRASPDYLANNVNHPAAAGRERTSSAFWRWKSRRTGQQYDGTAPGCRQEAPAVPSCRFEGVDQALQAGPEKPHPTGRVQLLRGRACGSGWRLDLGAEARRDRGSAVCPELFSVCCGEQAGSTRAAAVTEADVRALHGPWAGSPSRGFFDRYIHGTDDPRCRLCGDGRG
jgi:hypothetical protein